MTDESDLNKNLITETEKADSDQSDLLPAKIGSTDVEVYERDSGDPLKAYIREVSRYELLTREEESELTKEFKETGDIEIAKKLVRANLRLVIKIAMEYRHSYQNLLDLIQEGNIGLMKAVSNYDPDKGARLSYYSSWWIKSYILKFILDNFSLVKIGTTADQKKLFFNLMNEKAKLERMGINPDRKLISENLGVSEKSIEVMEERLSSPVPDVSIDTPVGEGNSTLGDLFASDTKGAFEDGLETKQGLEILKKQLGDFVGQLKPRDKEIFMNRLLNDTPLSLQEIANQYGVSRERIRQIESRLLDSLKTYMKEFIN